MWLPRRTGEPRDADESIDTRRNVPLPWLWLRFILTAVPTALAGWLLARAAVPISIHFDLSETLVGGGLTGLAGSMPELVTALAAVRMGALLLVVGDILGGNSFDVSIVGFSDLASAGGSVFVAVGP